LLNAGARFVGKTITDELAFSLNGKNAHYGTPVNTRAPNRIPGGSSSGSASAVAAGVVDFALGSDTGGSVRAPASYNGLYGIRPTHGRLPLDGCMPLAGSYDTPGWFARDANVFGRVARVLLGADDAALSPKPVACLLGELVAQLDDPCRSAFGSALTRIMPGFASLEDTVLTTPDFETAEPGDDALARVLRAFRVTQGAENWATQGPRVETRQPDLGPGVKERFAFARDIPADLAAAADRDRALFKPHIASMVSPDRVLVLPTVPDVAPAIDMPHAELENFRNSALSFLCLSGLSGLPQFTLPLGEAKGAPFGVSLIGPRGSDQALVELGLRLAAL
ncbi:MAG: amidase, partial [Pseudomonadota bacterium]